MTSGTMRKYKILSDFLNIQRLDYASFYIFEFHKLIICQYYFIFKIHIEDTVFRLGTFSTY
jgi:hypothetical protein